MSKKRLRHFNEEERVYVLKCLADGKRMPEIAGDYFQQRFPDFAGDVDPASRKKILYERVRNIKRNHPEDIQAIADLTSIRQSDLLSVDILYKILYNMWLVTPIRSLKNVRRDKNGVQRSVYKYNADLQVMIFKEARKLTKKYPDASIADRIPITDPLYRLHFLDRLLSEIPMSSFLRYSRKEDRDIYTSHVKTHVKIIKEIETEMKYLPDAEVVCPQSSEAREKIQLVEYDFFSEPL